MLPRQVPGQDLVGHDNSRSGRRQRENSTWRLCAPYSTTQVDEASVGPTMVSGLCILNLEVRPISCIFGRL